VKTILDSICVVEMTEALAGPYGAMLLGDFGAEVIKVERPGVGDQSRDWGPPSALYRILAKARPRSRNTLRLAPAAHLLQHHRLRIHWPESGHARI
jgi:hypothetical protein